MLKYDKLFDKLKQNGYTASKVRDSGLIGMASYYGMKSGKTTIDGKTIDKLCRVLNCQPGDLLEYVPDDLPAEKATTD